MNRFIDQHKDNWRRLENLLELQKVSGLRGLSRIEVREFGELYRRAAADLAIARAETRDPKLINYLNNLVVRAHGRVYRAESQGVNLIWKFFAEEMPQTFRANWRYMALATAVFMFFATLSGFVALNNSEYANALGLDDIRIAARTNDAWWLGINNANQIEASNILTNNIRVSLMAFAFGAAVCIGALFILAYNAIYIGGVVGVCYATNASFANELVTFMVAHGVVELSCIFFAAGSGMAIGYAIINPGELTRAQALKKKGIEATRIVIGCALFLVVAGVIEGFLSPSNLPVWTKISTGVGTGIAMYSYLFFAGTRQSESDA